MGDDDGRRLKRAEGDDGAKVEKLTDDLVNVIKQQANSEPA